MPPPQTPPKHEPVGPLVGIIIIVALIVAGGIYFLLTEKQKNETELESEQASNSEGNLVLSPNAI